MRSHLAILVVLLMTSVASAGNDLFVVDAELSLYGSRIPIAISEDFMIVGEPGYKYRPEINYAEILAGFGSSLGILDGESGSDALSATLAAIKLIAVLNNGLEGVGAAHVFTRGDWDDKWTFAMTTNNWDAAVRQVVASTPVRNYEGGGYGQSVAVANDWILVGTPKLKASPSVVLGFQDFEHEVGAITFLRPGQISGFELNGLHIADEKSWLNLGTAVGGGSGFAAAASGPKREYYSTINSSITSSYLHWFRPLSEGFYPWAHAGTSDFVGSPQSDIHRIIALGADLAVVRQGGGAVSLTIFKDPAAALSADRLPDAQLLGTWSQTSSDFVSVAYDGAGQIAVGLSKSNRIEFYTRASSGNWSYQKRVDGREGEAIGASIGFGGGCLLSLDRLDGETVIGWRERADGSWERFGSENVGRSIEHLYFHPESLVLVGPSKSASLNKDIAVETANIKRSMRVRIEDATGQPVEGAAFRLRRITSSEFTGGNNRLKANVKRHFGVPTRIWVDFAYEADGSRLIDAAGEYFYYDLISADQGMDDPYTLNGIYSWRATHEFAGFSEDSYFFEEDASLVPDWSDGDRDNGWITDPRHYDALGRRTSASYMVTEGDWFLSWAYSPGNPARVVSAHLRIETALSTSASGYMKDQVLRSGSGGVLLVDGLEKGHYLVEMVGGYSGRSAVIDLETNVHEDTVAVTIAGECEVSGRLTTALGSVAGYSQSTVALAGRYVYLGALSTKTDVDGRFVFSGLTPGDYVVTTEPAFSLMGGDSKPVTLTVDEPSKEVALRVVPDGGHRLTLQNSGGEALAGLSMSIEGPFGYLRKVTTDSDGQVLLGALAAGDYFAYVVDEQRPWGASGYPIEIGQADENVVIRPRGQDRTIDILRPAKGIRMDYRVVDDFERGNFRAKWTYPFGFSTADRIEKAKADRTLQREIRLDVDITFDEPTFITSAKLGMGLRIVSPDSDLKSSARLLTATPVLSLEGPDGIVIDEPEPESMDWIEGGFGTLKYSYASLDSVDYSRAIPEASTETWTIVLRFQEPQVVGDVLRNIDNMDMYDRQFIELETRKPGSAKRTGSVTLDGKKQVMVRDLFTSGYLIADLVSDEEQTLAPESVGYAFDLADTEEAFEIEPILVEDRTIKCRYGSGSPVPRVSLELYDEEDHLIRRVNTELDGAATLLALPHGRYRVVPSKAGHLFSPNEAYLSVGSDESSLSFEAIGAIRLPVILDASESLTLEGEILEIEPSEWQKSLLQPRRESLGTALSVDRFIDGSIAVNEAFQIGGVRLYAEVYRHYSDGTTSPIREADLVLTHPDSVSLIVQSEALDYEAIWRGMISGWHQMDASVPPVGFRSFNRNSWSWSAETSDYENRFFRPLQSFDRFIGLQSDGEWTVSIAPPVYDLNGEVDLSIEKVVLALSPASLQQATAMVAPSGRATFSSLLPGPYRFKASSTCHLPTDLEFMLRDGTPIPLKISTLPSEEPTSVTAFSGESLRLVSPIIGDGHSDYEWYKGGVLLAAGGSSLEIFEVTEADEGQYSVKVSNPSWSAKADVSIVSVRERPALTWAAPSSIVKGAAISAYATAESPIDGVFSYNYADLGKEENGSYLVKVTFTPTDLERFGAVEMERQIAVLLPAKIEWNLPDQLSPETTIESLKTATSEVEGSFYYTPSSLSALVPGLQTLSVTLVPDASEIWATTTIERQTRLLAPAVIDWKLPKQLPPIGNTALYQSASSNVAGQFTYDPENLEGVPTGEYSVQVQFTAEDTAVYSGSSIERLVEVVNFIEDLDSFRPVGRGGASWSDVDFDGWLDLSWSGETLLEGDSSGYLRGFYTGFAKGGVDGFEEDTDAHLPQGRYGRIDWHDIDNDGDLDFIHGGWVENQNLDEDAYFVYTQEEGFLRSSDVFARAYNDSASPYATLIEWGDFDHDGDSDLLVQTRTWTRVYENVEGSFQRLSSLDFPYGGGSAAWVDVDGDADLDLFFSGSSGNFESVTTELWENDGSGGMTKKKTGYETWLVKGADWSDLDGDGDLDAVFAFLFNDTLIMLNDGVGGLLPSGVSIKTLRYGAVFFADLDADGDADLLMSGVSKGYSDSDEENIIFWNDGFGRFEEGVRLTGMTVDGVAPSDYDRDGDLDIFIHGTTNDGAQPRPVSNLITNVMPGAINAAPTPPGKPVVQYEGDRIRIDWAKSSDDSTPQASLRYNISLRKENGATIMNAHSHLGTGRRRLINRGNAGAVNHWTLSLPEGRYVCSVQSIDAGFAASAFSETATFTVSSDPYQRVIDAEEGALHGKETGAMEDADGDGLPNIAEAFISGTVLESEGLLPEVGVIESPLSSEDLGGADDVSRVTALILNIPEDCRLEAGNQPTYHWGGYTFTIEGSVDLSDFDAPVDVVPLDTPSSDSGYNRHAFIVHPESTANGRFLRIRVSKDEGIE